MPCREKLASRPPLGHWEPAAPYHVSPVFPAAVLTVPDKELRKHVCGGRMFASTRIWRRWHRKINVSQKRYAVVLAIGAFAVPPLVMARGHRVESVPELLLVVSDSAEGVEKTQNAIKVLKQIEAYVDAEKAKDLVGIRPGKGKMRNQRYISRKGPLIVYGTEGAKLVKAFRNIPGVEIANVERLNLLKLTPGGHLGRFII